MYPTRLAIAACLCFCLFKNIKAQTGKFSDDFSSNKGWKFSNEQDADSVEMIFKDGSLIVKNKYQQNRRVIIEYTPTGSSIDFRNDGEWDCTVKLRHLAGPNNMEYGVCLGGVQGKKMEDGLNIGVSGNGYYKLSSWSNKKMQEIKPWTRYSLMKTNEGEVNELNIICRPYSNLYLRINNGWAFLGKKGYQGQNTFFIYVDGGQTIAIDDLTIFSFKSLSNKLQKHNIDDFITVCQQAVNNFAFAKGFESQGNFKTWLAPITISNREYLIQSKKGGIFPENVKDTSSQRFIYTIPQYFADNQLNYLEDEKKKLTGIIENGMDKFEKKELLVQGKKTTWYFYKGEKLPNHTIAWIEEYKEGEKNYLVVNVINAPDIAVF